MLAAIRKSIPRGWKELPMDPCPRRLGRIGMWSHDGGDVSVYRGWADAETSWATPAYDIIATPARGTVVTVTVRRGYINEVGPIVALLSRGLAASVRS